jgi:hypothetical protein
MRRNFENLFRSCDTRAETKKLKKNVKLETTQLKYNKLKILSATRRAGANGERRYRSYCCLMG